MPLYRSKIALAKGQLTLLGGRNADKGGMTDALSTWDEEKKQWLTKLPPIPKIRMRPCISFTATIRWWWPVAKQSLARPFMMMLMSSTQTNWNGFPQVL